MSRVLIFLGFTLCSTAYAIVRGGPPERLAAALFLLGVAASATVGLFDMPGGFSDVTIRLALIDTLWALLFTMLAVSANRLWLIPFAACQIAAALVHLARLLFPGMIPAGYAFLTVIWSWPMIGLLAAGTFAHRTRVATGSNIPHWKPFFRQGRSKTLAAWLVQSLASFRPFMKP